MKKQSISQEIIAAGEAVARGVPWAEVRRRLEAVKIKGDPLEGWTGSPPFHLDRSPACDCGAATEGKWADKHHKNCATMTSAKGAP